uniref:Uncharacterized protein n=1 Tax=Strongyloides stercoralis TaxID=6248 RepID=A0AAF5DFZ6_STRER
MVYKPDLSKINIKKKFKNIKDYFKQEDDENKVFEDNECNINDKNGRKKNSKVKLKSNNGNDTKKKPVTDKNNIVGEKKTYANIIKDAIEKRKSDLNNTINLLRSGIKKDNTNKTIVDKKIVDDKVQMSDKEEIEDKKVISKKKSNLIVKNQPSNENVIENCNEKQKESILDLGNIKKLNFSNFTDKMPSPNMGAIYDNFSTSVKYVRKGIKNMGQNIEMKKPDFTALKKKLSTITEEARRKRYEKLASEEYTTSTSDDLVPSLNIFVKSKKKKNVDSKTKDSSSDSISKKKKKNKKDKKNALLFLANLSVKDGKDKVPESVYNKLHMNNKFTKGNFTDSNGKPLWCKKANEQSVEESDDSSTDSGDICALVSNALLAYCDGNFQIKDQSERVCTLEPNGDLQEFTKNDHLYTMENVINNTVRTFSKMEEYKKSIKSLDVVKQGSTKINQMPALKFEKEIKVVIYNRRNPRELAQDIQFIPLDTGPSNFFNNTNN